jgi:hypothetical protein
VLRTTASPFLGAVASILRDWASDTEASRLWGPTTNNWNGRRMQQCTLIRARPSTPTLLHLHSMQSQRATEDTMLQSSGHLGRGRQHERSPDSRPMLPTRPCPQRTSWIDRRTRVCPLRANLETPVMLYWGAIPLRRTGAAPQSVRLRQREQHWEQAGWWKVASISINEMITVPGGAPRGGGWWHSPCVTNRSQVAACRATARLTSLC